MSPSKEEQNSQAVRSLWAASREGGTEEALGLLEPDAEWRLHIYPDRVFTTVELVDTLQRIERDRRITSAQLTQVDAQGDFVLAAGSFRWTGDDGGIIDFRGYWVYECADGRIISGESFAEWSDAVADFSGRVAEQAL